MANYRNIPLKICASSTGGADVDVSATLFVDALADAAGDTTLVNVHESKKCASLKARKSSGAATLQLVYVAVPMAGNGQFEVTVELTHPAIEGDPFSFTKRGNAPPGQPKTLIETYELP